MRKKKAALPATISVLALPCFVVALLGCDQGERKPVTVTRERSQSVVAAAKAGEPPPDSKLVGATPESAAPHAGPNASTSAPTRRLCGGKLNKPTRALPKSRLSRVTAPGATLASLSLAPDGFTWVNFWAAWCEPCKQEIPRLKSWEARLSTREQPFHVVFISLDDDLRQLQSFLQSQPTTGLRATYWLKEGAERDSWLRGVELPADTALPVHVLVDGHGKLRCAIQGAVEDSDYEQLKALLAER